MFKKISIFLLLAILMNNLVYAAPIDAFQSYARGLMASKAGDLEVALKEYKKAIAIDRDAVGIYRDIVYTYWQMGKRREAIETAKKLEKLAKDNLSTHVFLGGFYIMAGRSDLAKYQWEKVLKLDPENELAMLYLAAYYAEVDPDKAVGYWEKYLKSNPDSADGNYQMGVSLLKLDKIVEAREAFQKALFIDATNREARISLAQLYEQEEKFGAACQEYERYLVHDPNNIIVLMHLGGLYFRLKNHEAAEDIFLKAEKLKPEDTNIHFWLGILAEEKKDWSNAIKHFEFIKSKEESALILTRLSYYYSLQRKPKVVIKYLKKAIQLDDDNAHVYYLLSLAYFDAKKYAKSKKMVLKAIELKEEFHEAHFHLGMLLDTTGKFKDAVVELEKAIDIKPDFATALNYLGYSLVDRNMELERGGELIAKALEVNPDNGAFIDSMGWYYFKKGQFVKAEEWLDRAGEKLRDSVVFDHIGDIKLKLNKIEDAWEAYQIASSLDKKNKKIREKIKSVEKNVLPGTLQRKTLKRAVGNFLQISSLGLDFTVFGESDEYNFHAFGRFKYKRPKLWRVDILGSFFAPQMVIVKNREIEIHPKQLNNKFSDNHKNILEEIGKYFNTNLIDEFDDEKVKIEKRGSSYCYSLSNKKLVISNKDGTIREFSVEDEIMVKFGKYKLVEGLYLPRDIQIYFVKDDLSVKLKLRNFILNKKIKDTYFVINESK